MSLILDALRRADSERERGAVPGLHAQPVSALLPEAPSPVRTRPGIWIAVVTGAGLIAVLLWVLVDRTVPRQMVGPAVASPPVSTATPAAPAPTSTAPAPVPSLVAAAAPAPAVASSPRATATVPQPVAEPAPWTAPNHGRKVPDAVAVPSGTPAATLVTPIAPAATAVANAPIDAPITPRGQLPESIRSQLPPLAVGGSIYSASPPSRSVIIDGRLYRENDRLTAELTLEQIRLKSAVFSFRGYRFEIGY